MKVVVTGATGNLGTALVRRLLTAREDVEIVGLARRLPDGPAEPDPSRVRWTRVDLTQDGCLSTLRHAFRDADAVVHLAWGFQPSHRPDRLQELGVGGTRRVLEAATREEVPHLVHMSSVGAYSPKVDDVPVDETYPTDGIPTSMYSCHKSAAERLLNLHEASGALPRVTRMRPGIVGQRMAGSALLRYGLPGVVPGRAITMLPVLPLDRNLLIPMIHADDVAEAVDRALERRVYGAFNLAAPLPLTPRDIGTALGARPVHAPAPLLRSLVNGSWRARVQPLDPGWLDLAMQVPLLDTRRAHDELDWSPAHTAQATLRETVAGMRDSASGHTPVLRRRTIAGNLGDRLRHGSVARRAEP